jgi:uncharacterized membrane protein YhaH (DUF805 family)
MEWRSKILPFLFSPVGRLRRWWFIVTWMGCLISIPFLYWIKWQIRPPSALNVFFLLACFLPLVPKWVAAVRRCHDCGFSGWFAMPSGSFLICLFCVWPFLGPNEQALGWSATIMFATDIILSIIPGTDGPNRYGPATKEPLTPTESDVF